MLIEAEKRKSPKTGDKLHQTGDDYGGRESLSFLHGKLQKNGSGFFDLHDLSLSNSFTTIGNDLLQTTIPQKMGFFE